MWPIDGIHDLGDPSPMWDAGQGDDIR